MSGVDQVRRRDDDPARFEAFSGGAPAAHEQRIELPPDVQELDPGSRYDSVLFARQASDVSSASVDDLEQHTVGDCFFLAALGALATTGAGQTLLRDNVREARDAAGKVASYTVTFHEKTPDGEFHAVEVTVSPKVVLARSVRDEAPTWGQTAKARAAGGGAVEVWVAVYEHAFILYKGGAARVNGGSPRAAMELLTGKPAVDRLMPLENDPRPAVFDYTPRNLEADLAAGKIVVATTRDGSLLDEGGAIVGKHAYTVTGVVKEGGVWKVKLHNPWGAGDPRGPDPSVPFAEWRRVFDSFQVGSP